MTSSTFTGSGAVSAPRPARRLAASLSTGSWVALAWLATVVLVGVLASFIAPHDPSATDPDAALSRSTWGHLLGTDDLGRDTLSRLFHGGQVSLSAALLATGVALGLGVPMGLIAGYYGRWIDAVIMRVVDTIMTFPNIILAIAVTAALGPSMRNAMIAVGIIGSPMFARLVRAQALALREEPYVDASRTFGSNSPVIMIGHILPNSVMPVVVQMSVYLGVALLAEATLSFLGLGVQPPSPSWGGMLASSQTYMTTAPLQMLPPGIALTLTVLAFNALGESLRSAMDPRAIRGGISRG